MPSPKAPSAKLLARRGAKIVMNRAALDAAQFGIADGLLEIGQRIIAEASARAPRDPEIAAKRGVPMMADTGYVSVWALGKLVSGSTEVAASKNKPRGFSVPKDQVVMVAAFSSPLSHFAELGTIKETARPFLTPAFNAHIGGAAETVIPAMGKRVRAVPA